MLTELVMSHARSPCTAPAHGMLIRLPLLKKNPLQPHVCRGQQPRKCLTSLPRPLRSITLASHCPHKCPIAPVGVSPRHPMSRYDHRHHAWCAGADLNAPASDICTLESTVARAIDSSKRCARSLRYPARSPEQAYHSRPTLRPVDALIIGTCIPRSVRRTCAHQRGSSPSFLPLRSSPVRVKLAGTKPPRRIGFGTVLGWAVQTTARSADLGTGLSVRLLWIERNCQPRARPKAHAVGMPVD